MKTTCTRFLYLFLAFVFFSRFAISQEIVATVPNSTYCPGTQSVEIPITVQNLSGVYALSLALEFNNSQVSYVSYTANPALNVESAMTLVNCPPPYNKVKAAYFALTPLELPADAVLFTFTFNVTGSSELNWDIYTPGGCQFSDYNGQVLPSLFVNGSINAVYPDALLSSTPQICEGNSSLVSFDFFGGTPPFIFEYNDGVNPTVTDTSETFHFEFEQTLSTTTTWNLVSIVDATACSNTQPNRSTTTYVAPLSYLFTVEGGGVRCENGEALQVRLNGSQNGLLYELFLDGNPTNNWYYGNGDTLTFYDLTAAGVYTVVAHNDCGNRTMDGSATIVVMTLPEVSFAPLNPVCYLTEPFLLTGGSPEGGIYSGNGVENGYFHSEVYGPGVYTLTYTYTDVNGCMNTASQELTVLGLPDVNFVTIAPICGNSEPVVLAGEPAGGIFSGPGVDNGIFYPAVAGEGTHQLTYMVTSVDGCSNSMSQEVAVMSLPQVSIDAINNICIDVSPVTLNGTPEGGWFEGPGVIGNMFYPEVATPGTWTIIYHYTSAEGCTNTASAEVTVMPLPLVSMDAVGPLCLDAAPVTLTATPSGGIFSGDGVQNGQFIAETAGSGAWQISYFYTDENGCSSTSSTNVTVYALPEVYMYAVDPVCLQGNPVTLTAWPEGGTFSGNGVNGYQFIPSLAGEGSSTVTYTYTDEQGCSNTSVQEIVVYGTPQADFQLPELICKNADPVELIPTPAGGWFEGEGVNNNWFYPMEAGVGEVTITYHYDQSNCAVTVSHTIQVLPIPEINFPGVGPLCADNEAVTLMATPEGGTYQGFGVADGVFYPASVEPGTYTITYTYLNVEGCQNQASVNITVNEPSSLLINPVGPVCADAGPVELTASPEGGVFTGEGVIDNVFYPLNAGIGTWPVTYTYTNESGCTSETTLEIAVYPVLIPEINPVGPVCVYSGTVALSATPEGGYFSGPGVMGSDFLPEMAGPGTWTITYTLTNEFGCHGTSDILIEVLDVPQVGILSVDPVSLSTEPFTLTAFPEGGTFSGPGMVDNYFNPALAGVGEFTIYYTYTDAFGCSGEASLVIVVFEIPTVTFDPISPVCQSNGPVTLIGTPAGGVFSGPGVQDNQFFPAIAGPGTFILTYTWNPEAGGGTATSEVTVYPMPDVTFAVSGGGVICHEVESTDITLQGSETGYAYTLYFNGEPTDYTLEGTGSALVFTVLPVTGDYSINATSPFGCGRVLENTVSMTVNPELFAGAGDNVSILEGENTQLTGFAEGGTAPYTFEWYPGSTLNDPTSQTPLASPLSTTTYQLMVMDANNCMAMSEVTVSVVQILDDISGTLTYLNNLNTPLNSSTVTLYQNGTEVASTGTDENGNFAFMNLPFGTYSLNATTNKTWGGGNAVDGLLMLKHFVGQTYLTGLKLEAGDITGEGVINAHDALNTLRRFVSLLEDYSPVGDWVFDHPTLTIDGFTPQQISMHGLCTSDVNGDYMPSVIIKSEPTIQIKNEGVVSAVNGITSIPVISEQYVNIGAMSLIFNLPEGIIVNGVSVKSDNSNLVFRQNGQELRVAWCSLEPCILQAGDCLMTLSVTKDNHMSNGVISLDASSVMADENAGLLKDVVFNIPSLSVNENQVSISNYPNPFSQSTQFSYVLPEDGKVTLLVFNLLGEKVAEVVNTSQVAGTYQVSLDAATLSEGSYIYKLEVLTNAKLINQSGIMNITK